MKNCFIQTVMKTCNNGYRVKESYITYFNVTEEKLTCGYSDCKHQHTVF